MCWENDRKVLPDAALQRPVSYPISSQPKTKRDWKAPSASSTQSSRKSEQRGAEPEYRRAPTGQARQRDDPMQTGDFNASLRLGAGVLTINLFVIFALAPSA